MDWFIPHRYLFSEYFLMIICFIFIVLFYLKNNFSQKIWQEIMKNFMVLKKIHTPKTVTKIPKKSNLSNTEDVCITQSSPLSLKSPLESQETKIAGTPSLFISQHLKASQEVHLSGSQDAVQVMSDSQKNKLDESQTSLQTSDSVKYVQVTDNKSGPSSWQPGSIHSRKPRNKKQKEKG